MGISRAEFVRQALREKAVKTLQELKKRPSAKLGRRCRDPVACEAGTNNFSMVADLLMFD